jgi:hypothetical protein
MILIYFVGILIVHFLLSLLTLDFHAVIIESVCSQSRFGILQSSNAIQLQSSNSCKTLELVEILMLAESTESKHNSASLGYN